MKRLFRYFTIFSRVGRYSFMTLLEYRLDAIMGFGGSLLYSVGSLLFLRFLLSKINLVAGWDFYDMVLLYGVGQVWAYLYFAFSNPSLYHFNDLTSNGDMDFILLKPMNSMFLATLRKIDFVALVALIQPVAIIAYALSSKNYEISLVSVSVAVFSVILSVLITHLLVTALATLAFWTTKSDLGQFFIETVESSYPYEVYKNKVVRFIFLTIMPYALIANVPFRALINVLDYRLLLLQFGVLIMFFVIANVVWKAGLKRYQSASS